MKFYVQEAPTICIEWSRGPYEEILPPPLIAGTTPEKALQSLLKKATAPDLKSNLPKGDSTLKDLCKIGLLYHHQMHLREVVDGKCQGLVEQALYEAVIERRQLLSLRPLTLENYQFVTFEPVVAHLGDDRWRVGVLGRGRLETFTQSSPARALEHAQGLYLAWVDAEKGRGRHQTRRWQDLEPWIPALRSVGVPDEQAYSIWANSETDLSFLNKV